MDVVISQDSVPIRLTDERWFHIVESHDDLAGYYDEVLRTIEDPDVIMRGHSGALIAVRALGRRKYLAVIYKELSRKDGFVITDIQTSVWLTWPTLFQCKDSEIAPRRR